MKKYLVLFLIIVSLYALGHYFVYGSLMSECIYTAKSISIPSELAASVIITTQQAYDIIGVDPEYSCLPVMGSSDELVGPEIINTVTIGTNYFTKRRLSIEDVPLGTKFYVVDILQVTKHGFATIDSGPGPIYYLILANQQNKRFKVATAALGVNKNDRFLEYTSAQGNFLLEPFIFENFSQYPITFSFKPPNLKP